MTLPKILANILIVLAAVTALLTAITLLLNAAAEVTSAWRKFRAELDALKPASQSVTLNRTSARSS